MLLSLLFIATEALAPLGSRFYVIWLYITSSSYVPTAKIIHVVK
jgi:hypothetical protein